MVNEQNIYDPSVLAEKWLNGTISDDERRWFENWYVSFNDEDIELESSKYRNTEQFRRAMLTKIKKTALDKNTGRYTLIKRFTSIAAILLFVIAALYFYLDTHVPLRQTVQLMTDVAPGHNGAVLTLADGSKVILDSAGNTMIAKQGSTQIINTNGQLTYKSDKSMAARPIYNTLSTPRGRQYKVLLPDGTQVWLNAASSLVYPTMFTGKERCVTIDGEAYFEVAHNAAMPFIVQHEGMRIKVLGTHFNVNTYRDESMTTVSLLEGRVEINKGKRKTLLAPGQQAQLDENNIHVADNVDMEEVVAWKNGQFQFGEKTDIPTIMRDLSRWYNVDVEYSGPVSGHIGGSISRNVNASQVLRMLEATGSVRFKIYEKKILVMPGED